MYAVPIYLAPDGEIDPQWLWLLHWASFILTLPVVVYSAVLFIAPPGATEIAAGGHGYASHHWHSHRVFASLWALLNHIDHGVF